MECQRGDIYFLPGKLNIITVLLQLLTLLIEGNAVKQECTNLVAGISGTKSDGAFSICVSGGYENDEDDGATLQAYTLVDLCAA